MGLGAMTGHSNTTKTAEKQRQKSRIGWMDNGDVLLEAVRLAMPKLGGDV
jgi:hypothetical protein